RFHVEVALARPGLRADDFREQALRRPVTVEDAAFAALFIVDDELHGAVGIARPANLGGRAAVADQVARIGLHSHSITSTMGGAPASDGRKPNRIPCIPS